MTDLFKEKEGKYVDVFLEFNTKWVQEQNRQHIHLWNFQSKVPKVKSNVGIFGGFYFENRTKHFRYLASPIFSLTQVPVHLDGHTNYRKRSFSKVMK